MKLIRCRKACQNRCILLISKGKPCDHGQAITRSGVGSEAEYLHESLQEDGGVHVFERLALGFPLLADILRFGFSSTGSI